MPLRPDAMTIQSFLDSCHFHSPKPMPNGRISSWLDVPVDIAVLVLAQAWQLDALAPRLASINSTFHRASKETALLLQGVDVCPPRLKVTVPDGESIDPKDGAQVDMLARLGCCGGERYCLVRHKFGCSRARRALSGY